VRFSFANWGRDLWDHFRPVLTVSVKNYQHSKIVVAGIIETRAKRRSISTVGRMMDHGGPSLFRDPSRLVVRAVVDDDYLARVTPRCEDDTTNRFLFVERRNCR